MEFFEIQTRHNAMKAYIKYLTEFEIIFEKCRNSELEAKLSKSGLNRRTSILTNVVSLPFSGDKNEDLTAVIIKFNLVWLY